MEKIDSLLLQAAVLLDRQYVLIERLISTQNQALQDFENALLRKEQALNHVLDVYNYVFALTDHLVRYQKIAYSIPKLNQKSKEYRALNESMGDLKEVRNQIQHVNNDIENDYTGPLLGSVCWVSGSRQYVAAFHDLGRERSVPSIVLDTHTGKFIQEFCFVYNDKYYDLNKAIEGIRTFNQYIASIVKIQVGGKDYDNKDHFAAFCLEFQLTKLPTDAE